MLKSLLRFFLPAFIVFLVATSILSNVYGKDLSFQVKPWYEGAVATWTDTGANAYTISYKQAVQSDSAYTQIDTELVRGTRADILGLRANTTYDIRITDSLGNTQVQTIKTAEYDRSGFAHFGYSAVGAYNNDGTPKDGAGIIYVDNSNKNTVKYKDYTGLVSICSNKANISEPLIIRIIGTVDTKQRTETGFSGNTEQLNNLTDKPASDGYVNMMNTKNAKNLTIEGVGSDAEIKYWGMMFDSAEGIEIRNLTYTGFPEDATSFNYSKRIWLHNNTFNPGSVLFDFSADQDKEAGDGASDFSKSNENVTIAYNHYNGCHKTCLISGSKTSNNDHFTIHHNFFDMVHQRCPFTRNTDFHYYNNYIYKCITGVNGGVGTWMFAEANYLEDTPTSDISDSKVNQKELGALFCKEGGVIKGYNNVYDKCGVTKETVVNSRTERVESSNDFANFDTDTSLFYYDSVNQVSDVMHLTSGQQAKEDVLKYTGVMKEDVFPLYVNKPTVYESDENETQTTTEITTVVTTEATIETSTEENIVNIDLGEAVTGFESDTVGDTGNGISVTYDNANDTWYLKDTSSTASASLTVPFAQQTKGKIVIRGSATPSSSSSKWALVTIKGTDNVGNAEKEIISLATDASKILSVRTVNSEGAQIHTPIGSTLKANSTYDFKIVIDLDNQTAEVTLGVNKVVVDINAKSIDSFYTTTSKKSSRNINIASLKVGLITEGYIYGDVNGNGVVELTDAVQLLQKTLRNTKVGLEDKTDDYMKYIDIDGDGKLTSADVAHILQKIIDDSYVLPVK